MQACRLLQRVGRRIPSRAKTVQIHVSKRGAQVSIRVDDIQDWWGHVPAKAVMNYLKALNTKHCVGIIAGGGSVGEQETLGENASMVQFLVDFFAQNGDIVSACNHSTSNEHLTNMAFSDQSVRIEACSSRIADVIGVSRPKVLIPPGNAFNDDTKTACMSAGLDVLSSQITMSPCDLTVIPRLTPTGRKCSPDFLTGAEQDNFADPIFAGVQDQIAECGFSVIMFHPVDFALDKVNADDVDDKKLHQLEKLVGLVVGAGHDFVFLEEITSGLGQ